jgi:hypothetical protein
LVLAPEGNYRDTTLLAYEAGRVAGVPRVRATLVNLSHPNLLADSEPWTLVRHNHSPPLNPSITDELRRGETIVSIVSISYSFFQRAVEITGKRLKNKDYLIPQPARCNHIFSTRPFSFFKALPSTSSGQVSRMQQAALEESRLLVQLLIWRLITKCFGQTQH